MEKFYCKYDAAKFEDFAGKILLYLRKDLILSAFII